MADLRGKQLKDSYQYLVTLSSGGGLENGRGEPVFYEEGEWTPEFRNTSGFSYARQAGHYFRIGKIVTARFILETSSGGSNTQGLFILNLPYPISSSSDAEVSVNIERVLNINNVTNHEVGMIFGLYDNQDRIRLRYEGTDPSGHNLTEGNLTDNSVLWGSATYVTT